MLQTGRADVDAHDTSSRMAECELRRLPRSTPRDKHVEIRAVLLMRPKQMELGAMNVLVLPQLTRPIQILHRRWIRMVGIEITDRIEIRNRFALALSHLA